MFILTHNQISDLCGPGSNKFTADWSAKPTMTLYWIDAFCDH